MCGLVALTLKRSFGLEWEAKRGNPLRTLNQRWLVITSEWVWQMPGQLRAIDLTFSGGHHWKHIFTC